MAVDQCVFCAIASHTTPAPIVARTEHCTAFLDRAPVFVGHTLVVPNVHVAMLPDLAVELLAPLFGFVQDVAAAVAGGFGADGSFVAVNNVVSQSVPHLHVHVIPRHRKDGLRGFFWPRVRYAEGEADQYAARLRAAMVEPC